MHVIVAEGATRMHIEHVSVLVSRTSIIPIVWRQLFLGGRYSYFSITFIVLNENKKNIVVVKIYEILNINV